MSVFVTICNLLQGMLWSRHKYACFILCIPWCIIFLGNLAVVHPAQKFLVLMELEDCCSAYKGPPLDSILLRKLSYVKLRNRDLVSQLGYWCRKEDGVVCLISTKFHDCLFSQSTVDNSRPTDRFCVWWISSRIIVWSMKIITWYTCMCFTHTRNTVFSTTFYAVPGLTTRISCPSTATNISVLKDHR